MPAYLKKKYVNSNKLFDIPVQDGYTIKQLKKILTENLEMSDEKFSKFPVKRYKAQWIDSVQKQLKIRKTIVCREINARLDALEINAPNWINTFNLDLSNECQREINEHSDLSAKQFIISSCKYVCLFFLFFYCKRRFANFFVFGFFASENSVIFCIFLLYSAIFFQIYKNSSMFYIFH